MKDEDLISSLISTIFGKFFDRGMAVPCPYRSELAHSLFKPTLRFVLRNTLTAL